MVRTMVEGMLEHLTTVRCLLQAYPALRVGLNACYIGLIMRSRTAARLGKAAAFVLLTALIAMPSRGVCVETPQAKAKSKWFKFPTISELGLIEVWGEITDSGPYVRQIRKLAKNPLVKGIVLRIDSPGGDVGATQEIYNELIK